MAGSHPPAGMRWVGYGHEAIAVSVGWGTNVTRCGRPQRDTVLIDRGTVPACYAPPRGGVESVKVTRGPRPFHHLAADPITIDGVRAERRVTTCRSFEQSGTRRSPEKVLCSGSLYFPGDRVGFKVESSIGPVGVDELLARVHHLPDLVGVPASRELFARERTHSGAAYLRSLRENGLRAEVIRCRECGLPGGYVLGTKPAAGTMRPPGSRVIVIISAPARGSRR
ncbi:MAG TPA: PASTA domain-containing protein [Sporichthyaceae bacterium]